MKYIINIPITCEVLSKITDKLLEDCFADPKMDCAKCPKEKMCSVAMELHAKLTIQGDKFQ